MQTRDREKESRDSIILMLLILLFGFLCIILASGWALRFAPSWKLDSNMGSNLNPDSDFLTNVPIGFFEPLDPSILTNPAWIDVFLTPGASFSTPIPVSTSTNSPTATNITGPTATNPPADTPVPTNTLIFFPPASSTPKPPTSKPPTSNPPTLTPTATSVPASSADLQVTKTDGVTTYTPGGTLTYTVTISNNGPSNVAGAVLTDNKPAKVASWSWACTSQTGGATGCNAVAGSTTNFTDTVNLPNGASIVYTVTANISAGVTGNLTNTAAINVPAGYTDPTPGNNSATDIDTQIGVLSADLQITKTDGVTTYPPGGTLTYTITVTNNGPSAVTAAVVTDNIPAQVTSWSWACTSQTGGASGCSPVAGSTANFTDTVDLPNGASIVYTVTANISAGATGNLTNTAAINVPAGYTDPTPANNSATDTDTVVPSTADLQITKTDGASDYAGGIAVQYVIVASNPSGPSGVSGATVVDNFSAKLTAITWTCSASGGASCAAGGSGDINDASVNLPVGGSVTYTVNATVIASPTGSLVNTATVSVPASVTDPTPGNNSSTDTDQLVVSDPFPYGNIGTTPDGASENILGGTYLILQFGTPLVVGAPDGYDLVYYPDPTAPTLQMDAVILQIGDGSNWYTILNWGNGSADTNTDLPGSPPNPTDCSGEPDNCLIDPSLLINSPGISIQLDGVVPNGTYPYVRIISPPGDSGDGVDVDAIVVLP